MPSSARGITGGGRKGQARPPPTAAATTTPTSTNTPATTETAATETTATTATATSTATSTTASTRKEAEKGARGPIILVGSIRPSYQRSETILGSRLGPSGTTRIRHWCSLIRNLSHINSTTAADRITAAVATTNKLASEQCELAINSRHTHTVPRQVQRGGARGWPGELANRKNLDGVK